jgi:hypothetical protein
LVSSKLAKSVQEKIQINQTSSTLGLGRVESSVIDRFVLTRRVNQPELIFNESPNNDHYFDSADKWHYSNKEDCNVCLKSKYFVMIFDKNQPLSDLKEIKD